MSRGDNIWVERRLLESKAFRSLSAGAHNVLAIFWLKRKFESVGRKGKEKWFLKNNGEITFTYIEAQKNYEFSASRFRRAIDDLLQHGFIDVAASGGGIYKVTTLYAFSNRWEKFGLPEFKTASRPQSSIKNPGFRKGNKLWQGKPKSKLLLSKANTAQCSKVNTATENSYLAVRTNEHGQKVKTIHKWRNNKWLASKIA